MLVGLCRANTTIKKRRKEMNKKRKNKLWSMDNQIANVESW
jgi:hypothetical protein